MKKDFYHQYKYKKDTPEYKTGWKIKWCGSDERYYPYKPSKWKYDNGKESIYLDKKHKGYSVDDIKDSEWFEPIGTPKSFIPSFPSKRKIDEYVYLDFETRLISDVDECRALDNLFASKKFQNNLYNFVRDEYNNFYKLNK